MPDVATVSNWISNNGEFRDMYALAREFQAHCIADEVIELADEVSIEWVEKVRANGRVVRGPDRKNLPRYRLRTEVRHWVAEQLLARARRSRHTGRKPRNKIKQRWPQSWPNSRLGK